MGRQVLPASVDRFNAYQLGVDKIKVVIVGQDPYPTKGHAHGLAFSVLPHIKPLPGSLRNIFAEVQADLGERTFGNPRSGYLGQWQSRGVFLLNTILTVEEGKPLSHKGIGWEKFTYETLRTVSEKREPVVWMLWGKQAGAFASLAPSHHLVLRAGHPSPLSYRLFRGCRHFSKACEFLGEQPDFWKLY